MMYSYKYYLNKMYTLGYGYYECEFWRKNSNCFDRSNGSDVIVAANNTLIGKQPFVCSDEFVRIRRNSSEKFS